MAINPLSITVPQFGIRNAPGIAERQPLSGIGTAKLPFSSSLTGISNGNPVAIPDSSTGLGYAEIHRFSYGVIEEVYLWCGNKSGSNVNLTMSFGDNTFSGENIIVQVNAQNGLSLVYPGVPHQGNSLDSQALYLRAASASSLNATGFIVRSFPFPGKDANVYGFYNAGDD
jgi:hypothetical protein|tara:strand:- start:2376 stop:2888 length:513 start_codon:yes stop_codon:yes gene_type:complete